MSEINMLSLTFLIFAIYKNLQFLLNLKEMHTYNHISKMRRIEIDIGGTTCFVELHLISFGISMPEYLC